MNERAETSSRKRIRKRPADVNRLAQSIVEDAVSEEVSEDAEGSPPGRAGGLKGGPARADKLDEERRQEIARNAARARWGR